MGMSEIQAIQTSQNQSAALAGTTSTERTESVCALEVRHHIACWLNTGSRMSGDAHVRFCERLGVQLPWATHLLLAHPSREWLDVQISIMREYLASQRKLILHPNKIVLRPFHHGIDWLGYALSPGYRVMRTKTRRRLWRNVKDHTEEYLRKERNLESLSSTIASYDGILKTGWNGTDRRLLDMLRRCL